MSGIVKVFDSAGVFRFSFSDQGTVGMFLSDTILFGTRRWDEYSEKEEGGPPDTATLRAEDGTKLPGSPSATESWAKGPVQGNLPEDNRQSS